MSDVVMAFPPRKEAKIGAQWAGCLVRTGWLGLSPARRQTLAGACGVVRCNDSDLASPGCLLICSQSTDLTFSSSAGPALLPHWARV